MYSAIEHSVNMALYKSCILLLLFIIITLRRFLIVRSMSLLNCSVHKFLYHFIFLTTELNLQI